MSAAAATFAFVRYCNERLPAVADQLMPKSGVVATAMVGATLGYSWLPRTVSYFVLTPTLLCVIGALCLLMITGPERSFKLRTGDIVAAIAWGAAGSLLFYTKFSSSAAGMTLTVVAIAIAVGSRRTASITAVGLATFVVVTVALDAVRRVQRESAVSQRVGARWWFAQPVVTPERVCRRAEEALRADRRGCDIPRARTVGAASAVRLRRPLSFGVAALCTVVGAAAFLQTLGSHRPPWELSPIVVFAVLGAIGARGCRRLDPAPPRRAGIRR